MRVVFYSGTNGLYAKRLGMKVGVIDRSSRLRPQAGEEWEVAIIKDTAPGERRGVLILSPIARIERWEIDREKGVAKKFSGSRLLEEHKLEPRYRSSSVEPSLTYGGVPNVIHWLEYHAPDGQVVEYRECEIPRLPRSVVDAATHAIVAAWRAGKPEASMVIPYRHKYGGTVELRWTGTCFNGFGEDGKAISSPDIAILRNGEMQWAQVRASGYGHQNEFVFTGYTELTGVKCPATEHKSFMAWARELYARAREKLASMDALQVAFMDIKYASALEELEESVASRMAEEMKQEILARLEKAPDELESQLRELERYGRDVVTRYLPMQEYLEITEK
ncbi:MAG: hypothetical protein K6U74_17405 [Firmicutes bacterium]|nr:hypothetical protein [Bacillota bacterium]